MSIEAMKQALEALRNAEVVYMEQLNAMYALQQVIAEAEKQEPVGYVSEPGSCTKVGTNSGVLHKEWVGLHEHELQVLDFNDPERGKLARAVEAKLKERNT
jgi:hypothetical protein